MRSARTRPATIGMAVALGLALSSCGDGNGNDDDTQADPVPQEETESGGDRLGPDPSVAAFGTPLTWDDGLSMTFVEDEDFTPDTSIDPDATCESGQPRTFNIKMADEDGSGDWRLDASAIARVLSVYIDGEEQDSSDATFTYQTSGRTRVAGEFWTKDLNGEDVHAHRILAGAEDYTYRLGICAPQDSELALYFDMTDDTDMLTSEPADRGQFTVSTSGDEDYSSDAS